MLTNNKFKCSQTGNSLGIQGPVTMNCPELKGFSQKQKIQQAKICGNLKKKLPK